MKWIAFVFCFLCMFKSFGQQQALNIIPIPVAMLVQPGTFFLTDSAHIGFNNEACKPVAEMLSRKLQTATGFNIIAEGGGKGCIQLKINNMPVPKLGNEGYDLEVTSSHISICANQPAGLFYGVQTLLQLFPNDIESNTEVGATWKAPAVSITDYPRFLWRGLMLDVSRHFFTPVEVMAYIDEMSRFKFNTLHLHLSDDNGWRVEIKAFPKLTEIGAWRVERAGQFGTRALAKPGEKATYGGFYTHSDIRQLVAYAQARYVTIVPEIDVPGHSMAAIASYPWLSCTNDTSIKVNPGTNFAQWFSNGSFKMNIDNSLNPSDERVYRFLDSVFTELAHLFPAPYIHVGGDECYKGYWKKNRACKGLMKSLKTKNIDDVQGYFMTRIEKILASKGKMMLGWDELATAGVSDNAALMCWHETKVGEAAARAGRKVVMSPSAFAYLDYYQGEPTVEAPVYAGLRLKQCYTFNPAVSDSFSANIIGGQGNLWTENIPTLRYAQYMTYPRALALAEVFWSKNDAKNWNYFLQRVENQFVRFNIADINYSNAMFDVAVGLHRVNGKIGVDMQCEAVNTDIFYTIDGTMPDKHALRYSGTFSLPEGNITIRVQAYRGGVPIGHLIVLNPENIAHRAN